MLRDKIGNKLYRQVWIKVIFPEKIFAPKIFRSKAGPGQGLSAAGIADLQMQVADKLEQLYPFWEFRIVDLKSPGRVAKYVFTFAGYRPTKSAPVQVDMADFTIPSLTETTDEEKQDA